MRVDGPARRDAPGPLRGPGPPRRRRRRALQRGDVSPRYHATTRPSYVEAVATARAMAFARAADAPVHVVHLSSAAALDEVRRAKAAGVRVTAETCPHYLALTDERYDDPDPAACARLRDLAAAAAAGRPRRAVGGPRRRLARPRRHRPRPRPARPSRRPRRPAACRSTRSATARRASRRCSRSSTARASPSGRITVERMVDLLATTPARRFGLGAEGRDRGRPRRRPRPVRPRRPADDPRRRPPPHERLHAVRGPRGRRAPSGASSSVASRRPRRRVRRDARLRAVRRARRLSADALEWHQAKTVSPPRSVERRVRPQRQELREVVVEDEPIEQRRRPRPAGPARRRRAAPAPRRGSAV